MGSSSAVCGAIVVASGGRPVRQLYIRGWGLALEGLAQLVYHLGNRAVTGGPGMLVGPGIASVAGDLPEGSGNLVLPKCEDFLPLFLC